MEVVEVVRQVATMVIRGRKEAKNGSEFDCQLEIEKVAIEVAGGGVGFMAIQ